MMGRPLDFNPGERYAYSNLGYLVLGRIIEATTGENFEAFEAHGGWLACVERRPHVSGVHVAG